MRILARALHEQRDLLLVAASLALSVGVNFAPTVMLENIHPSVRLLAGDGIFVGTIAVLLLQVFLPTARPQIGR